MFCYSALAAIVLYIAYFYSVHTHLMPCQRSHPIILLYYIYLYFLYLFLFYIMWLYVLWCMLVSRIVLWWCIWCIRVEPPVIISDPVNPCVPSPCGPNSQCRVSAANEQAVCSCLQHYVGRAPNCRPECTSNSECAGNMACINLRCQDPCVGTCGISSTCLVNNHRPICRCLDGYAGDPFSECSPQSKKVLSLWFPCPRTKANLPMFFAHLPCSYCATRNRRALQPESLWCQCRVQGTQRRRLLHLPARVQR